MSVYIIKNLSCYKMDQFNNIFNHFPQYCIIVYKEYKLGIILTHFKTYYDIKYIYLTVYIQRDIIQAVRQIIKNQQKVKKI